MFPHSPPFQIVLVEPEIPPNTGNIARTCAATGSGLHLVHPLGFEISDRQLKRAGLDYWPHVNVQEHSDLKSCLQTLPGDVYYFSKKATRLYTEVSYRPGDIFVFGPETRGLPEPLLEEAGAHALRIPMITDHVRSLNLATSVAVVLFEAVRQLQAGPQD